MKTRLVALLLAVSAAGFAADRDFDRLVKAVEFRFGVQRTHIPFLGVANFFVKVVRPAGAAGFKLAVFEDFRFRSEDDGEALDRMMADASAGLHPMVRVRSRRSHEWTYIYTGEIGRMTKMLIATFERHEATIVQVELNMKDLLRALEAPGFAGKTYGRAATD